MGPFFDTLLESLGLPIPSLPTLMVAGALAGVGKLSFVWILVTGIAGALIGDLVWYFFGILRGRSVLRLVCHLSLNKDSCVSQTESFFARFGVFTLVAAKFIPGLNTVAPPMAGLMRMPVSRFLVSDGGGAFIWVLTLSGAGLLFHNQVETIAALFRHSTAVVVITMVVAFSAYLVLKRSTV